jgi:4-diphosphocytidyl-2-C-methyl-D-erythritol kinase
VVTPGIHVSTPEAYRALAREAADPLTSEANSSILREFQTIAWNLNGSSLDPIPLKNDFEEAVFATHKELAAIVRKLRRLGANPALMTGSGSALFGVFRTAEEAHTAASQFRPGTAFPVRFVSRRRYRSLWRRAIGS